VIDHDFDPYHELMVLKHNSTQLIRGQNNHETAIGILVKQHNDLIANQKQLEQQIQQLRGEIYLLKQSMTK